MRGVRITGAAVLAAAVLVAGPAQAGKYPDLEIGLVHDDNLGRAELDEAIESDTSVELGLSWTKNFEIATGRSISLTGGLGAAKYDEFDGMDTLRLSVSSAFRNKFGLGPEAPWFSGSLSVDWEDYDEDVRDGLVYTAEALVGKLLSDRWDLSGGLSFEARRADENTPASPGGTMGGPGPGPLGGGPGPGPGPGGDKPGDTFDLDQLSALVNADFTVNDRVLLSFGLTWRDGDVASTAIPNDTIIDASDAIVDDPVFGDGFFAYRIEAEVLSLAAEVDIAVGVDASVVVGYEHQATDADAGIDYDKNLVRANYVRTF